MAGLRAGGLVEAAVRREHDHDQIVALVAEEGAHHRFRRAEGDRFRNEFLDVATDERLVGRVEGDDAGIVSLELGGPVAGRLAEA